MVNLHIGQIYVCTKSNASWWVEGNEYKVEYGQDGLVLIDEEGTEWYEGKINRLWDLEFKLGGIK